MQTYVPNVPEQAVREYTQQLLRVCAVSQVAEPGHWWFEHQMRRLLETARVLRAEAVGMGSERGEVRRAALRHARVFWADQQIGDAAYKEAKELLGRDLPHVRPWGKGGRDELCVQGESKKTRM